MTFTFTDGMHTEIKKLMPEWANSYAMDECGYLCYYECIDKVIGRHEERK